MVTSLHRMAAPMKRVLPGSIWGPLRAVSTAVVTPFRFSLKTGHFKSSLRSKACTRDGDPLPWYTYPAIDFLSQRSFADKHVLEFGGGQSTLWWGARAKSVLTIEENEAWAEYIKPRVAGNVAVHHVPADTVGRDIGPVEKTILAGPVRKFDIIVIDGHLRYELVPLAFNCLAPGGAVIMDNSEGYDFIDQLRNRNCRRVDFFGFCPGGSLRSCTSIAWVEDSFLLKPDIEIPYIETPT